MDQTFLDFLHFLLKLFCQVVYWRPPPPSRRILDLPLIFVALLLLKDDCNYLSRVAKHTLWALNQQRQCKCDVVLTGTMSQRENSDLQRKMPLSNKYPIFL